MKKLMVRREYEEIADEMTRLQLRMRRLEVMHKDLEVEIPREFDEIMESLKGGVMWVDQMMLTGVLL